MVVNAPATVSICLSYLCIFVVGVYASWKKRSEKSEKLKDVLVVGRRDFGVALGTMTLTATWIGGGYINGTTEGIYDPKLGLIWTIAPFSILLSMLFNARFIAGRMRDAEYVTMLDPIQYKLGRMMAALCFLPAFLGELLYAASILSALGSTLKVIVGLDINISIIISAIISVMYTLVGGIYSVAYTDVVQLGFMMAGLYVALPFVFTNPAVSPIITTNHSIANSTGWIGQIPTQDVAQWIDILCMLLGGDIPWQEYFQRILASKTSRQSSLTTYLSVAGFAISTLPAVLFGAAASSTDWNQTSYGLPSPSDRNETALILPIVLNHLTPIPIAVLGLTALSAATMSSTDSTTLAAGTLFSHNVYKSLWRPRASDQELTLVVRIGIIVFGVLSCLIALYAKSIYGLFVLCTDIVFVVLLPQLISCLFLDVNKYGAYPAYFTGLILRVGAGEQLFNIDPFINYPGGTKFPFRIFSMTSSMVVMVTLSNLARILFQRKVFPAKFDVLKCRLSNDGRSRKRPIKM